MPKTDMTLDRITDLLARAKKAGADDADAVYVEGTSLSVSQRLGKMEKLERSEGADLGLRVLIGKQQAVVSSSDTSESALKELVERAVAMAKNAPEDPFCGIADPSELAETFDVEALELCEPGEVSQEKLIAWATACEEAARSVEGITNSEGADAGWGTHQITLAATNGFANSYAGSGSHISVSVLAGTGTGMERDYDYDSAVFSTDLRDPVDIGLKAAEKTLKRLNPRKVKSTQVPVIYDPRVSASLVGHLAGAINGSGIARGTSFLLDAMGKEIFAPGINIIDNPHRKRGLRSKPFDAEGVANEKRHLIENGVLKTWIMDLRSARQLGLKSTGNASRGAGSLPGPSTTNLYMEPGTISPADMIKDIKQGLYITEMIGSSVNGVTGDYSRGASGFWIENGELAYPVSEITVAGNLKDMFRTAIPANDLTFKYGTNAPTIRVDGMTLAGQ
ncbi:modulator protein [Thalassospira lucentensis]|uniref:Modulator protein n=1 Tax=Thalassospira lucentensis TaxID=168935 RepID=A0A154L7H1_9PROT|nr:MULTISPECIES: TldD/PmbA family protein [Thalassospira]KZB66347.1 modulator protein [Thalassospira lucentensis]MCH2275221.1 TldD/PmbA family protein [Thalassospira sp.]RCK30283.1 modulator protein [Thalassospira xiamenensis]